MNTIIAIFKELTTLQRCSGNHNDFIEYMKKISLDLNYECLIDDYKNILCRKSENANLVFQSHYDIVCLDDNCIPTFIQDGDIIKADNTTLGADNGIGCAYMIALMQEGYDCEFLFTSDEEIGLIGANNLNLPINAKYMLNLDSEEEGEICIGCAGGVDIFATYSNRKTIPNNENYQLYEVSISKLQGGHSGVDINKNIPNGIKLLINTIKNSNAKILDINGGERINSIPVNVKAIIACKNTPVASHENIKIEKIETKCEHLTIYNDDLVDYLDSFQNGVLDFNDELNVVQDSINLAKIKTTIDGILVEFSARSMKNENLQRIKEKTIKELENIGCEVRFDGKYPAWAPDINEFTNSVLEIYKTHNKNASLEAIHAGLECAIFKDKYPHLKIASIGPTITFPHSRKEHVSINSTLNVYNIVRQITENFK